MTVKGLHPALACFAAAGLVAASNAVRVEQRIGGDLRFATRLGVHLYDLSLFFFLGGCIAVTVLCAAAASRRFERLRALPAQLVAVAAGGCAFGVTFLSADFANFAANHGLWLGAKGIAALAGLVLFFGLVGVPRLITTATERVLAVVVGLASGYANGGFLVGDYPGVHLAVALVGVVALETALRDAHAARRMNRAEAGVMAVAGLCAGLAFAAPPSRSVRQNLTASSGSVVMPFVAPFLAKTAQTSSPRLPIEQTAWFSERSKLPPVAPTRAELLPPNAAVVFFTVDALRTDVVESRRHDQVLPNLARIRDASLRFTNARSPSPSTVTTVSSILSGKYYSQLYFTQQPSGKVLPVSDRSERVPELLTRARVHTVQVLALHGLDAASGVGRGFASEPRTTRDYGRAAAVMDLVLGELEQLRSEPSRRLFLYSHFVDSHAPYTLGGKRATEYESYIAELELVDRELGRLLASIERQDLRSRCLVIVAADHGEAFGEHGQRYHARSVYDELLRVPLMFLFPKLHQGQHSIPVTLLDVSATLLDVFGVETPGGFMGQSLVPWLTNQGATLQRPIAADSGRRNQALIFDDGVKVHLDVMRGTTRVFDLRRDPEELHDLTDDPTRNVEPYIGATERFFATHTLKVPGWKPPWRSF